MTPVEWAGLIGLGFAAGVAGGLLGVGGGILFVPALVVFADQSQLGARVHVARGHRAGRRGRARGASTATATCARATA